jgi:hypothetical protein
VCFLLTFVLGLSSKQLLSLLFNLVPDLEIIYKMETRGREAHQQKGEKGKGKPKEREDQ